MALGEVTGGTVEELESLREDHRSNPLFREDNIPFETAFCLTKIGKQPDDYEGETRFCQHRASKLKRDEWDEHYPDQPFHPKDERAYCLSCNFHGRNITGDVTGMEKIRLYAGIKHGLYAEDEHLKMDFDNAEQILYDGIMEQWPEAYDWPPREEDPARYEMLDMVASNVVRRRRAEDYIDDEGEVRIMDRVSAEGIIIEEDGEHQENPIAGEDRRLIHEITNLLKELGLTPKERAKQGTREKGAEALESLTDVVNQAVVGSDGDYDPDEFEE
jgi:hypothetical protein